MYKDTIKRIINIITMRKKYNCITIIKKVYSHTKDLGKNNISKKRREVLDKHFDFMISKYGPALTEIIVEGNDQADILADKGAKTYENTYPFITKEHEKYIMLASSKKIKITNKKTNCVDEKFAKKS